VVRCCLTHDCHPCRVSEPTVGFTTAIDRHDPKTLKNRYSRPLASPRSPPAFPGLPRLTRSLPARRRCRERAAARLRVQLAA
jgi:hypothetical protein